MKDTNLLILAVVLFFEQAFTQMQTLYVYTGKSSSGAPCSIGNCSGTVEQPFLSLLEALEYVFRVPGDFQIITLDKNYEINENEMKAIKIKNYTFPNFSNKNITQRKSLCLKGGFEKANEAIQNFLGKTKINFTFYTISFALSNIQLSISDCEFLFPYLKTIPSNSRYFIFFDNKIDQSSFLNLKNVSIFFTENWNSGLSFTIFSVNNTRAILNANALTLTLENKLSGLKPIDVVNTILKTEYILMRFYKSIFKTKEGEGSCLSFLSIINNTKFIFDSCVFQNLFNFYRFNIFNSSVTFSNCSMFCSANCEFTSIILSSKNCEVLMKNTNFRGGQGQSETLIKYFESNNSTYVIWNFYFEGLLPSTLFNFLENNTVYASGIKGLYCFGTIFKLSEELNEFILKDSLIARNLDERLIWNENLCNLYAIQLLNNLSLISNTVFTFFRISCESDKIVIEFYFYDILELKLKYCIIHAYGAEGLIFNKVKIIENEFFENGMTLRILEFSNSYFKDCEFISNKGFSGGALYFESKNAGFVLENCLFLNNTATEDGGAILLGDSNKYVVLRNCKFLFNSAKYGAGLYFSLKNRNFTIFACIFKNNKAVLHGGCIHSEYKLTGLLVHSSRFENNSGYVNISYGAVFYSIAFAQEINFKNSSFISSTGKNVRSCLNNDPVINNHFCCQVFSMAEETKFVVESCIIKGLSEEMLELIRIDGPNNEFQAIENQITDISLIIINDYCDQSKVLFTGNVFQLSISYSFNAVFLLSGYSTSYVFKKNVIIGPYKYSSLNYVFDILHYNNAIVLENLSLRKIIIDGIIRLMNLRNTTVEINSLDLSSISLFLILARKETSYASFVGIRNIVLLFNQTIDHIINLKAPGNVTLERLTFLVTDLPYFGIFYSPYNKKRLTNSSLQIRNCEFRTLEYRKSNLSHTVETEHSLITVQKLYDYIIIYSCNFMMIGKKSFNSLLMVQEAKKIIINRTLIVGNILNSNSHLLKFYYEMTLNLIITNCKIKFNRVVFGGFLTINIRGSQSEYSEGIDFNIKALKNEVIGNRAINRGGVLYVNSSYFNPGFLFNLLKSSKYHPINAESHFKNNSAPLGFIFYWEGYYCLDIDTLRNVIKFANDSAFNKLMTNNSIYGSSIELMKIAYKEDLPNKKNNQTSFQLREMVFHNKRLSNDYYYCIVSYDRFGNQVIVNSFNEFKAYSRNKFTFYEDYNNTLRVHYEFYKGAFCASYFNFLSNFENYMGNSAMIKFEIKKVRPIFYFLKPEKFEEINIYFDIDDCKAGEVFNGSHCIPCARNKYFKKKLIKSLDSCIVCSEADNFYCYGGNLRSPKKNFWRLNFEIDTFLRCPSSSCLGDEDFIRNATFSDCESCYFPGTKGSLLLYAYNPNHTIAGFCKIGYRGILCTECTSGYGSSDKFKCSDCSNIEIYFKQGIILIVTLIIFYYCNWKALQNTLNSETNHKAPAFIKNVKASYLLKVILKYASILVVMKNLPIEFHLFEEFFSNIIGLSLSEEVQVFSYQCLLRKLGIDTPPALIKLVFNMAFFIISLMIFIFFAMVSNKSQRLTIASAFKNLRVNLVSILLIFLMDNISLFLGPFIRILFCIDIEEKPPRNRLLQDLSIFCWENDHLYYVQYYSIPVILIFGIILPLYILIKILLARFRNELHNKDFLHRFGYFIYPYRKNMVYFEICFIASKLFLICFKELFVEFVIKAKHEKITLILLAYLSFIYFLHVTTSPFGEKRYKILQKVERNALIVNISNTIVTLVWNIITDNFQQSAKYILIIYVIESNLVFIIYWIQIYFGYFKSRLKFLRQYYIRFSKWFSKACNSKFIDLLARIFTRNKVNTVFSLEVDLKIIKKQLENSKLLNKLLIEQIKLLEIKLSLVEPEDKINSPCVISSSPSRKNIGKEEIKSVQTSNLPEKKLLEEATSCFRNSVSILHTRNKYLTPEEFKVESNKVKGKNRYDTYIEKKISFDSKILKELRKYSIEILDEEWVVAKRKNTKESKESNVIRIGLRKITPWVRPPFQKVLSLRISAGQNNTNTEFFEIEIKISDFFSLINVHREKDLPPYGKQLALFSFDKTIIGKLLQNNNCKKNMKVRLSIFSSIINIKLAITQLELHIDRSGNVFLYGEPHKELENFFCIFAKSWVEKELASCEV